MAGSAPVVTMNREPPVSRAFTGLVILLGVVAAALGFHLFIGWGSVGRYFIGLSSLPVLWIAGAAALWAVPLLPLSLYLSTGWKSRKEEVLALFDTETIERYFCQFYPGNEIIGISIDTDERAEQLKEKMDAHYTQHMGYWRFLSATGLLAIVVLLALSWIAWTVFGFLRDGDRPPMALPWLAIAAFSGAYLWITVDLMDRWKSRCLTERDPIRASARLAIAVPFGYAVAGTLNDSLRIPAAFLLGLLPFEYLIPFGRKLFGKLSGTEVPSDPEELEIAKLPCVDARSARAFADEGVTTVSQLAYSDPVVLTIRSQLEFVYVSECVNVALLWRYIGEHVDSTRSMGIGGAQEAANLFSASGDALNDEQRRAIEEKIQAFGKRAGLDNDGEMRNLLYEVAEDPYTIFLSRLWRRPSAELVRAVAGCDYIFRGEVLEATPVQSRQHPGELRGELVTYRLHSTYKGNLDRAEDLKVHHVLEAPSASEPPHLVVGEIVIVLARNERGDLRACGPGGFLPATPENERRICNRIREIEQKARACRASSFQSRMGRSTWLG